MARRGTFGRSPRPASSLTNTIISIAREMQQQNDQNIADAWQKGGRFKGHKVTDEEILAYWKKRAAGVDKHDPLYDTYNSAYIEYDYSIHESKVQTAYAQGKMNDHQAASFYLNWAKKVPKNSEFWRVLQRDAAQFTRASRANSDAAARRALEVKYQNDLKGIADHDIAPGAYLTDVFGNLAKRGLRPGGGNPLIDPMNGELYQFDANDVQEMLGMIDRLTKGGSSDHLRGPNAADRADDPSTSILYHDDMGNPVTAGTVLKKLQGMGFKGNLTLDSLYSVVAKQKEGLLKSQQLAEKTGHLTDATRYGKQLEVTSEVGREIKAWPVEQTYLTSREAMLKVVNDPAASAYDIKQAVEKYRSKVAGYAADPSIAADDVFRNKLIAESQGTAGTATAAEDFTGLNQSVQPREIAGLNLAYERATMGIEAVNSGVASWTTGEYDKQTGVFTPSPGGSAIGAADAQTILNHSGGIPTQTVFMPDKGGRFQPVTVMGQSVTIHSYGPDGKEIPVKQGTSPVVATIYGTPSGKQLISYKDGKGNTLWSDVSHAPWGSGATLTESGKGFDLSIKAPGSQAALANSGFELQQNSSGQSVLVYTPSLAMLSTDAEHKNVILNGGGDPHTDFRSANIAYYDSDVEGQKHLASLKNDDAFNSQVSADTYFSTGYKPQRDDKGNFVGWVGGDQSQLDRANTQNGAITSPAQSIADHGTALWDRKTPAAALVPDQRYEDLHTATPFEASTGLIQPTVKPLATSQIGGTEMGALGGVLQNGTLNLASGLDHGSSGINDIKLAGQIKVPSAPVGNFTPNFSPTPNPSATLAPAPTPTSDIGGGFVNPTSYNHPVNDFGSGK
jgi:hypothetical protein